MKKVFVGLSGGVDSAVAAALLKKAGYEVIGGFIKISDLGLGGLENCAWREERREAIRVAAKLGCPLLTYDLSEAYRRTVLDYLINEYRLGRTPNPDVMCNQQIKFGEFFRRAISTGADFVATGHYVRRRGQTLLVAKDQDKDQSYFLWTLTPAVLDRCLFPIGDYQKSEVRQLAKRFGLPNASKPDSQGLCFVGPIDFKDFLRQHLPQINGVVLNETGEVVGEHDGSHFYTIGERHGFKLTRPSHTDSPQYVVAKDHERNTLTIAPAKRSEELGKSELVLTQVNWLAGQPPNFNQTYQARIRYRAPVIPCQLESTGTNQIKVVFKSGQIVAPGQSGVIYDGETCLGGGVIL